MVQICYFDTDPGACSAQQRIVDPSACSEPNIISRLLGRIINTLLYLPPTPLDPRLKSRTHVGELMNDDRPCSAHA